MVHFDHNKVATAEGVGRTPRDNEFITQKGAFLRPSPRLLCNFAPFSFRPNAGGGGSEDPPAKIEFTVHKSCIFNPLLKKSYYKHT